METQKVKILMGPSESMDKSFQDGCLEFLRKLGETLGNEIVCADMSEVKSQKLPLYFIASGGAESEFVSVYEQTAEPYILLTTQEHNSLAAAMEIMGYLQEHGLRGEIIHGSFEEMAERLNVLLRVSAAKEKISRMRLGCLGTPDGLVASDVDFEAFHNSCGAEMVMIDMQEILEEYENVGYPENEYTEALKRKADSQNFDRSEIEKALAVYGALKRIVERYRLDAVTVKCFDLLHKVHMTGCLALAILNAEGIPAACEGDQKSLVSMTLLHALTGQSGFMANPNRLDPVSGEILFAHCTLPLDLPDSYEIMTHFESGIGVAFTCDLAPQPMTVFKCNGSLSRYYAGRAELVETTHKSGLCRAQMRLHMKEGMEYFLRRPIGNHHIICKGDWKGVIDEFFISTLGKNI